jgi:lambda repressor-like predicted transcriptional regulator
MGPQMPVATNVYKTEWQKEKSLILLGMEPQVIWSLC